MIEQKLINDVGDVTQLKTIFQDNWRLAAVTAAEVVDPELEMSLITSSNTGRI